MAFNENGGMTVSDVMALRNSCGDGGFFGGDGSWIFFLFFLLAWGGNGFGNWGNGGGAGAQGALSRAEMYDGFATQGINNALAGISNGLCDGFYATNTSILQGVGSITNAVNSGFGNLNTALCNGFNGVNTNISNGVSNITAQLCDLGYAQKDCCCQTQRAIDSVNYNMARNTNDIMTANAMNTRDIIDSQNTGFQRIIDFLTEDKIDSLRTELQAAQLQLGNLSQTNTIINTLRPIPQPAYLTCSPYASATHVGAYNNYNCGCNCGC